MRARAHHQHRAELGDVTGDGCEECLVLLMATAPRRSEPEPRPDPAEVARLAAMAEAVRRLSEQPTALCDWCDGDLSDIEIARGERVCAACWGEADAPVAVSQ